MTIDSSQNKRSSCKKFMQMMRNILKLSSSPLPTSDVRSSSSHSLPHRHHTTVKQSQKKTPKRQNSHHLDGLDGGGSSSFIKIQGIEHRDIETDDVNWYNGMQTSELKTSVTNLKASDYIRRFHERNKHESVSLALPPPPPPSPPPHLRQTSFSWSDYY